MLKLTANYNLTLQAINRLQPKTTSKLAGEYIKIFPVNEDAHRAITNFLSENKLEYYITTPPAQRPMKYVIKGLPITTDPNDIRNDLENQGLEILKIVQLTQIRTKSKLPIYLFEIKRDESLNKINDISECLFFKIKIEIYTRRPSIAQCWNCNFFNHSSSTCGMTTRCLKCGQQHKTNVCPIKDKIENPKCINCKAEGHVASWKGCPAFPRLDNNNKNNQNRGNQNRQNQNKNNRFNASSTNPNFSYAQAAAASTSQNRNQQNNQPESNSDNRNPRSNPNSNNNSENFSDMFSSIKEILNLFKCLPQILNTFSKMKTANNPLEKLEILFNGIMDLTNNFP